MRSPDPGFQGYAAADLGMGMGDMLAQQARTETEEERKKRMAQMQLSQAMGPAQSLSGTTLFGATGGPKSAGY